MKNQEGRIEMSKTKNPSRPEMISEIVRLFKEGSAGRKPSRKAAFHLENKLMGADLKQIQHVYALNKIKERKEK